MNCAHCEWPAAYWIAMERRDGTPVRWQLCGAHALRAFGQCVTQGIACSVTDLASGPASQLEFTEAGLAPEIREDEMDGRGND